MEGCLPLGKGFSQYVRCHVVCRTINQLEGTILSDFANKMISLVDVFGPRSVVVVFNESERGLIVAKEGNRSFKGREKFEKKSTKL
jgi:hypothetical protein